MDFDSFLHLIVGVPCVLIECYISKNKYSSSSKSSSKDRGTLILIWIFIAFSQVLSAHYVRLGYGLKIIHNHLFKFYIWIPVNISLYIMGFLIRKQSIEQLGKWFTTIIRIDEHQQLIDVGWYGKVRHPSYAGVLLYFLASAFLLNNWLGLFGTMIPIGAVFLYRIYVEEQELGKHFGQRYDEYRQKVPYMLLPKVF